jgi:hypothetical protein
MTELSNEELKRLAEDAIQGYDLLYPANAKKQVEFFRVIGPRRILSLLSQLEQLQAENAAYNESFATFRAERISALEELADKYKAENAELKSRLAASEKDAARYRWLRDNQHVSDDGDGWLYFSFDCDQKYSVLSDEQLSVCLDESIDIAIQSKDQS